MVKDSSWIKVEDVKKFAAPFLKPEIDTSNLIMLFTETSFMDQTLNAITLTYAQVGALPDSMTLRNWDIYVDPKLQTVQRVYIVKEEFVNGKAQMIQLTWKTGAWCKIVTIPDGNDNIADIKEVTVIWNFDK